MNLKNPEKIVKAATIGIVIYLLCFGVAMAFFPIRPFWNDEWRLIYNLKFKTNQQLWGQLDLLQQCPRVYLTLLKKFTSFFDYSYTAMRLPALITAIASIFLLLHLKKKIVPGNSIYSYLFILILISSQTFTDYLVQVKQYEIEIFVCLLALWQLVTLLEICDDGMQVSKSKYFLLCFTFAVAPFFSYTYPIAVAPVIPIVILYAASVRKKQTGATDNINLLTLFIPLIVVFVAIIIFYIVDVKQLMADSRMYTSYRRMLGHDKDEGHIIENFWKFFSLLGSGLMFEVIFGALGISAFCYGIYRLAKTKMQEYTKEDYFKLYAVVLSLLTLALIFSGKLMGGVARLTAFTVPSISILIISFIEDLKTKYRYGKLANVLAAVVFLGLYGNVVTTYINMFTYPEYSNRIKTYWNSGKALKLARLGKMPILITDGVRGDKIINHDTIPGQMRFNTITPEQIAGADTLCAEVVLKVNPEYKTWDPIPVYWLPDTKWTAEYMLQLPHEVRTAMVCDGINFKILNR